MLPKGKQGVGKGVLLTCKVPRLTADGAGGLGQLGLHLLAAQMTTQPAMYAKDAFQILGCVLLLTIPAIGNQLSQAVPFVNPLQKCISMHVLCKSAEQRRRCRNLLWDCNAAWQCL